MLVIVNDNIVTHVLQWTDPPFALGPGDTQYVAPGQGEVEVGWQWNDAMPAPVTNPPAGSSVTISDGDMIPVVFNDGTTAAPGSPATAHVAGGALTNAELSVAPGALVADADSITVTYDDNTTPAAGSPAAARVTGTTLDGASLTIPPP